MLHWSLKYKMYGIKILQMYKYADDLTFFIYKLTYYLLALQEKCKGIMETVELNTLTS